MANPIAPMTLGNVRANGVHHMLGVDGLDHHHRVLDVSSYPDNLSVQQADKFTLVINLKFAKALGITCQTSCWLKLTTWSSDVIYGLN